MAQLRCQLLWGWAVPLLPDLVEGPVAKRRVATAAEIEITFPHTSRSEVAAPEHRRLELRRWAEVLQHGHRGVQLLDRRRRPGNRGP